MGYVTGYAIALVGEMESECIKDLHFDGGGVDSDHGSEIADGCTRAALKYVSGIKSGPCAYDE